MPAVLLYISLIECRHHTNLDAAKWPNQKKKLKMPTSLDVEEPLPSQQTGSKAKGKRAAPKAKAASKSNLQASVIDMDEPPGSTQNAPHKRGRPKGHRSSNGDALTITYTVQCTKQTPKTR